jgi:hypothetical protein
MDLKELNIELRTSARRAGLCDKWFNEWDLNSDHQTLIDKYKKGIDFVMENNFPSNEFIVNNIDKELLEKNNIYVNTEFYVNNPDSDCVILDSNGKFVFSGFSVRDIYVNGASDIEIEAKDHAKIYVTVYGCADVHLVQRGLASIRVYKNTECNISFEGNVKVHEKD